MGTPEVPLEHAHETIEHHAEHAGESWMMGVALTAAVLAAMAAITALCVEYYSEESMRELIKANDLWNESQAESIKEKELETQAVVLEAQKKELNADNKGKLERFSKNKDKHRDEAKEEQDKSEAHVRKHLPLSLGLTMFQVAIAIGAVSVLTKLRAFWFLSIALGVAGTGFLIWGVVV
jgi:hypothetical protein